ncbi:MAG: ribose-5-phosphate isomerase RpiA [Gammaproteobacteria bacterium]|nr:ribose-5-phosphate isomerase RpiA [Gammaproteobacteria bacterium]
MIQLKQQAAIAALSYAKKHRVIGIGTGSTVEFFIDQLATIKSQIDMVVSSSERSTLKLKQLGFLVVDLNYVGTLPIYIDGADEIDVHKRMIKGGGGALTKEKILATASKEFICMVDASKHVDVLGKFPVAVEVLPLARGLVARELLKIGGDPVWRENFITDSGNIIIDVHNLDLTDPLAIEMKIKQLPGVVENGIFAKRRADVVICASEQGVQILC